MNDAAAVTSVCILRLSALGDATHVLPLIRTVQRHRPDCRISWILGKAEAKLMEGLDGVELIPFDKGAGLTGVKALSAALAGRRFDALLHMQLALRANLLSSLVPARRRIGYDLARSKEGHRLFVNEHIRHDKHHVLDVFGLFAEALGFSQDRVEWRMPVPEAAREWAARQWPDGQPTLLVSPCSSHVLRNWPAERYAEVARHAQQRGWQVVLCGGRSAIEQDMAAAIKARMPDAPIDLVGKDTLKQLPALLERADLVLSPDSGPAHIANAMGSTVLGLHACTDAERSGPYSDRRYCINKYAEAAERFAGRPASALPWGKRVERPGVMELIRTGEVIDCFERYRSDAGLA